MSLRELYEVTLDFLVGVGLHQVCLKAIFVHLGYGRHKDSFVCFFFFSQANEVLQYTTFDNDVILIK